MLARKAFELAKRIFFVKYGGIAFKRVGRVEDASTTARRLLRADCVRGTIGAKEEFGRTRRCGFA